MSSTQNITKDSITCPFCGKVTSNPINTLGADRAEEIIAGITDGGMIQRVAPELSVDSRELLISGICYDCQVVTFG